MPRVCSPACDRDSGRCRPIRQRLLFEQRDFMARALPDHLAPGPDRARLHPAQPRLRQTWWKTDLTPQVRAFGLDTCNQVAGPDGAVPDDQFRWLETELATAQADNKLVLILSHHNSLTLENRAQRPGSTETLHGADGIRRPAAAFPGRSSAG